MSLTSLGLLPEQQRFIDRALRSHALMVAGPGTGKTLTLSAAAERLVADGITSDYHIELLTLTRAMAERLGRRAAFDRACIG